MLWPLTQIGNTLDEYERSGASARRIFDLMDTHSPIQDTQHTDTSITALNGDIRFEHVNFYYQKELPILNQCDFHIPKGHTVGIAGTTGSGKSTLIKCLLRLYDIQGGELTIDQTPIKNIPIQVLRRHIALVSQDVYLFHGSIKENIAYACDHVTDDMIINASKQAELHPFVDTLPNGYDSIIGERGIKLSGGQRQRWQASRAILKDAHHDF